MTIKVLFLVGRECNLDMSLNEFLREVLELRGTKVTCREGGCGACVVAASFPDLHTKAMVTKSVSSVRKYLQAYLDGATLSGRTL